MGLLSITLNTQVVHQCIVQPSFDPDEMLEGGVAGVYRVTPVEDMYMRSSAEPFDGVNLALSLTYAVHSREGRVLLG